MKMEKLLLLAVTCLLHGLAAGDVSITTTGEAGGRWYHSTGIFVAGRNHLVFEAKASRDALVGLATSDSDDSLRWEFAIGGGNNQPDFLRSLEGETTVRQCDRESLDPNNYRTFWISWEQTHITMSFGISLDVTQIRLGTGNVVGTNQFCSHQGPASPSDLYVRLGSYGALNAVDWIIHGYPEIITTGQGGSWFDSTGIFVTGRNHLVFETKTSRDAIVGLATLDSDETLQWEVVVGGGNNRRDIMRSKSDVCHGQTESSCWRASLDPDEYRAFWISWDETSIKLGTGTAVGQHEHCSHDGSFKLTDLYVRLGSYGALNTVNWIVHSSMVPDTSTPSNCDGSSCHSNAYCKQTRDGTSVCKCNLGYTGDGQNCQTVPAGITPDQQGHIQTGLDAASLIGDLVANDDSGKFSTGLRNFASTASTFAPAVSLVFGLVFMVIPVGDDALTLEMRESFLEVNRKLDQIQDSIEDLSDKADWNGYKEKLRDDYVTIIKSCARKLDELARLSPGEAGFDSKKRDVMIEYDNNLGLGREFTEFLTLDFLGENIFSAFARFVDNDRKQVHTLMRLTLQSLMNASKIEMANIPLGDDSPEEIQGRINHETENWCGYFEAVQNKMVEVDEAVEDAWHNQAKDHDIPDFARDNRERQHSDFVRELLDLLVRKYYWRFWFVASYDEIGTWRKHAVTSSENVWSWFRSNGRNLVVASAPKEATFDQNAAQNSLTDYKSSGHYHACCGDCSSESDCWRHTTKGITNCCWSCCSEKCDYYVYDKHAEIVYDELPWHGTMKFVVQKDNGLQAVSSLAGRLAQVDDVERCDEEFSVMYFG